jgi:hypothetical protein
VILPFSGGIGESQSLMPYLVSPMDSQVLGGQAREKANGTGRPSGVSTLAAQRAARNAQRVS